MLAPALALVLVLFALGALLALRARRRRQLPARTPPALPSAPAKSRRPHVVLVHGFAGFSEIRVGGVRTAYFRGVRERFEELGIACTTARLPAVAPIAERAAALEALLASLADFDVHVIAHSMGGLDARRAINALGGGPSARQRRTRLPVLTLVTIATPHRGTPLAELGHPLPALRDLSAGALAARAGDLADVPGVRYASVVAAPSRVHPLLRASYLLVRAVAGENDGIVPVSSQAWGDVLATIDADHWGAIGWSGAFDAPAFYEELARETVDPRGALRYRGR